MILETTPNGRDSHPELPKGPFSPASQDLSSFLSLPCSFCRGISLFFNMSDLRVRFLSSVRGSCRFLLPPQPLLD